MGKHYQEGFKTLPQVRLADLLHNAPLQHEHGTIVPHSIDCVIPGRGAVNLDLHVSSLRVQETGAPIGMALVIDDRTDIKRAKAEAKEIRDIFGRYVHPSVVNRLIADPQALNLGGETREITVLFADIRGSTRLGEITPPAIFNAPLAQEDHALRAVRAALGMREGVLAYQRNILPELHVAFGFGLNTGQAVVGNLGSGRMQNYTAIGDTVNVGERIQGKALDNDILINHTTFLQVRQYVRVEKLAPLYVKNKTEPLDVFRLKGWL